MNTLWGSFEIRNVRLIKMMLSQLSGWVLLSMTYCISVSKTCNEVWWQMETYTHVRCDRRILTQENASNPITKVWANSPLCTLYVEIKWTKRETQITQLKHAKDLFMTSCVTRQVEPGEEHPTVQLLGRELWSSSHVLHVLLWRSEHQHCHWGEIHF